MQIWKQVFLKSQKVEFKTLNEFIKINSKIIPNVLKLDVEGYEVQALMGALQTINRSSPLIVIEWLNHGEKYGWSKQNILGFLSGLGYNSMKEVGSDMMFKRWNYW